MGVAVKHFILRGYVSLGTDGDGKSWAQLGNQGLTILFYISSKLFYTAVKWH